MLVLFTQLMGCKVVTGSIAVDVRVKRVIVVGIGGRSLGYSYEARGRPVELQVLQVL